MRASAPPRSAPRSFALVSALLAGAVAPLLPLAAPRARAEEPAPPSGAPPGAPAAIDFTLLYFNDLHGHLRPHQEETPRGEVIRYGGVARLGALARSIRAEREAAGARTFVLFAGDLLMGTPISMVFRGEPDLLCLRLIGVDVFAIGNHEFDFGQAAFERLRALAAGEIPIVSCNIDRADGAPLVPGAVELDLGHGFSLCAIGATTEDTPITTFPDNVTGLVFHPPAPRVRAALAARTARGPAVLVSHLGWKGDRAVAESCPELFAIVGGHDQVLFPEPRAVGAVRVGQAFEKAKYLGQLDCRFFPATGKTEVLRAAMHRVTEDLPEDAGIRALVESYERRVEDTMREPIGETAVRFDGGRERVRYEETNLGSWLADVMREATGAEVALLNAGAVRSSFERGPITLGDAFRVFPYPNGMWVASVDGATLERALRRAVRATHDEEDGGFMQVSGLRIRIRGTELVGVEVGGAPLDRARIYKVALSDFIRAGGDGYDLFKDVPAVDTGTPLRDAVIEAIQRGRLAEPPGGRIIRE